MYNNLCLGRKFGKGGRPVDISSPNQRISSREIKDNSLWQNRTTNSAVWKIQFINVKLKIIS